MQSETDTSPAWAQISSESSGHGVPSPGSANLHDPRRIARCLNDPAAGPQLLFFSGGTALNGIAAELARYTRNSVHLVTPFDNGRSSGVLRRAFAMPAVGDLRSRLMALADPDDPNRPGIRTLFSHRLPADAHGDGGEAEFAAFLDGSHALMEPVRKPARVLVLSWLDSFARRRPSDFDFRHASIGNLILTGGYVASHYRLEPVLAQVSELAGVQGTVRASADVNLNVGVELADGTRCLGQVSFTGKDEAAIEQPVRRLFLTGSDGETDPAQVPLPEASRKLLGSAGLICYPPGSLFSSVIANLLPAGTGTAIAGSTAPKVYIPSLGKDPEAFGKTPEGCVEAILSHLRRDAGADCPARRLMTLVLCDQSSADPASLERIRQTHGIATATADLVSATQPGRYCPRRVCDALVSLA